MNTPWKLSDALTLCCQVEAFAPKYGMHVALTGGLLYKDGPRKDCDLLLYRVRDKGADWRGFWREAKRHGLILQQDFGWCKKCIYQGMPVDVFDPEDTGEYGDYFLPAPF